MDIKFYYCEECQNLVVVLNDSGVPMKCCGQPMIELVPNTGNASPEKHLPILKLDGTQAVVTVGTEEHPMDSNHFIEWIALQTGQSVQCKPLSPDIPPSQTFHLCPGVSVEAVYAFCNLHGLWKSQV